METLEKGVVVQVTGELSNNGQQMRRFFQTIVLAPKSPTNYYVRNDIFRYQDEIFFDEEDASSEMEKTEVEAPPPAPLKTTTTNSAAPATPAPTPTVEIAVEASPKQINGHPEEKAPAPSSNEPIISRPAAAKESSPAPKQRPVETAGPRPAPVSWASRVADSSHVPSASQITVQKTVDSPVVATVTSPVTTNAAPTNKSPKDQSKRPPRGQKKFEKEPSTAVESDGEEIKKPVFADDQQVFVGNLPQDITEDELKTFFSSFGTILDVRINRTNQKSGAGRTPNYGFVTFDNPNVVKKILNQKVSCFNHVFHVILTSCLFLSQYTSKIIDSMLRKNDHREDRLDLLIEVVLVQESILVVVVVDLPENVKMVEGVVSDEKDSEIEYPLVIGQEVKERSRYQVEEEEEVLEAVLLPNVNELVIC